MKKNILKIQIKKYSSFKKNLKNNVTIFHVLLLLLSPDNHDKVPAEIQSA